MMLFRSAERFSKVEGLSAKLDGKIVEKFENPTSGGSRRRVKTRFLQFDFANGPSKERPIQPIVEIDNNSIADLVLLNGPERGKACPIRTGVSNIGRADDQEVQLPQADVAVSRTAHASIACYGEHNICVVRDGMKPNPVFLNGKRITGERMLSDGDILQVGRTLLEFRQRR